MGYRVGDHEAFMSDHDEPTAYQGVAEMAAGPKGPLAVGEAHQVSEEHPAEAIARRFSAADLKWQRLFAGLQEKYPTDGVGLLESSRRAKERVDEMMSRIPPEAWEAYKRIKARGPRREREQEANAHDERLFADGWRKVCREAGERVGVGNGVKMGKLPGPVVECNDPAFTLPAADVDAALGRGVARALRVSDGPGVYWEVPRDEEPPDALCRAAADHAHALGAGRDEALEDRMTALVNEGRGAETRLVVRLTDVRGDGGTLRMGEAEITAEQEARRDVCGVRRSELRRFVDMEPEVDGDGLAVPVPSSAAVSSAEKLLDRLAANGIQADEVDVDVMGGLAVYFTGQDGRRTWVHCSQDGTCHSTLLEPVPGVVLETNAEQDARQRLELLKLREESAEAAVYIGEHGNIDPDKMREQALAVEDWHKLDPEDDPSAGGVAERAR